MIKLRLTYCKEITSNYEKTLSQINISKNVIIYTHIDWLDASVLKNSSVTNYSLHFHLYLKVLFFFAFSIQESLSSH